jgi:hypothetical protein
MAAGAGAEELKTGHVPGQDSWRQGRHRDRTVRDRPKPGQDSYTQDRSRGRTVIHRTKARGRIVKDKAG